MKVRRSNMTMDMDARGVRGKLFVFGPMTICDLMRSFLKIRGHRFRAKGPWGTDSLNAFAVEYAIHL